MTKFISEFVSELKTETDTDRISIFRYRFLLEYWICFPCQFHVFKVIDIYIIYSFIKKKLFNGLGADELKFFINEIYLMKCKLFWVDLKKN